MTNTDKELHYELLEVTKESMELFINTYPLFCVGLEIWIMQRANELDIKSLNHFQRLVTALLEGTLAKMQKEIQSGEIH